MQLLDAEGERSLRLEAALASLRTDLAAALSELEEAGARAAALWEGEAAALRDELSALAHRGDADRLLLAERADDAAAARRELVAARRRESAALERIDRLASELGSKGERIDSLERRVASEADRRAEVEARAARLEAECAEARGANRVLEERARRAETLVTTQRRPEAATSTAPARRQAARDGPLQPHAEAEAEEARVPTAQRAPGPVASAPPAAVSVDRGRSAEADGVAPPLSAPPADLNASGAFYRAPRIGSPRRRTAEAKVGALCMLQR